MNNNLFLLFLFSFLLSSCGMIQKVAVGTTGGILFDATKEIETDGNWELLKEAIPGNLKMMEGLHYLSPEDENILAGLAKGYAGLAFAIDETIWLDELYKDVEDGNAYKQMVANYSKAFKYGLKYLELNGVSFNELKKKMNEDRGIYKFLDDNLSNNTRDLEGALFTAQSLGSLIFANKTNMTMVAYLPIVKGMFDWVCEQRPDINYGACSIFYGAYEAGRPRMLGGNPEKGKQIFQEMFKKYPHNWLGRTAYIRFYLIPMADEDGFKEQKFILEKATSSLESHQTWKPVKKTYSEFKEKGMLLYQSVAIKRYNIIKKFEEDLF